MVMRLHWHGWRILITGDAGFETEKELLESGLDLQSDVWIMGRHRSDYTGTIEFVQAVSPKIIVAGEESYPLEERIPDWWAAAIAKEGIDLWRQSETGAVMMEFGEDTLELRSFLPRGPRRRLAR
jgi:beta-lactamase superfamily II metal-dependent hydrolase